LAAPHTVLTCRTCPLWMYLNEDGALQFLTRDGAASCAPVNPGLNEDGAWQFLTRRQRNQLRESHLRLLLRALPCAEAAAVLKFLDLADS